MKIGHNGTRYEGKNHETIARRIWGRNAEVIPSPDPNSRYADGSCHAQIVRKDKYGTHILAEVMLYPV